VSIAVLIPVLNRPKNAQAIIDSVRTASRTKVEPVFVCSPGDTQEIRACRRTRARIILTTWEPGAGDYARKINLGFSKVDAPLVLLGADDLRFHKHWDESLLAVAEESQAGVVGTNDGWNALVARGLHATHPLVARDYIEEQGGTFDCEPGVVYFEGYDHQSVDSELVAVARARDQWAFAEDSLVEHLHPLAKKSAFDETYRKGLARGREDRRIFARRHRAFLAQERRRGRSPVQRLPRRRRDVA
jgi:glycosyltransferase involved in cell wall biosynthesis